MSGLAIITGASSGIGQATAYKFASCGFDLLLIGRSAEKLKKTFNQCQTLNPKIKIHMLSLDFKKFDVATITQALVNFKLQPTVLVNNAGMYSQSDFINTTDWYEMFEVNLFSAVKITQTLWPIFEKNKKGSIINVSSTLGLTPTAKTSSYSASKAAMINWTISLAQEGGAHNIRANCICPGIVDTPIHSFHNKPNAEKNKITENLVGLQLLNVLGQSEDIAESIYFLASDLSKWTTGATINVDGGIHVK